MHLHTTNINDNNCGQINSNLLAKYYIAEVVFPFSFFFWSCMVVFPCCSYASFFNSESMLYSGRFPKSVSSLHAGDSGGVWVEGEGPGEGVDLPDG